MIKGKINIKISKTVLFSIVLFLSMVLSIHAENISQSDSSITDSLYSSDQADTTVVINENAPSALSSSTISISDSSDVIKLAVPPSGSGPDTVIVYSAKRRMVFNVKSKIMYLNGDSKLKFSQQNLEADNIQILFDESLIKATATKDADGKGIGYPEFTDKGETFYGETILYNFKTKQGTIKMGETKMSEGFYYGDKIKMLSKSELFIKDGCYTTCDAPHPHYYFGSPKMKVVAKDKVFIDPIIFYVEDMPIFILPVGLFFPNKTGRQSGIMIPSFNFSHNRGISFEDFGFYWAASDYYDTQIRGNYYSKGGYVFKNNHRWKLRDVHSGSLDIEYGETRFSPDDEFKTTYKINLKHNHTFSPQTRINAAVNYMGGNHLRNTSHSYRDILKQNVSSNAGFSHSFDDWGSISLSMNADQNISTKELSMSFPNLSYSLPTWKPLKSVKSLPKWMQNVSLRYSGRGEHNYRKQLEDASLDSVNFRHTHTGKIVHSPSISISPKFGYFTFQPSVSFGMNNYFRRVTKRFNPLDSTIEDHIEDGFFSEYRFNTGVNVSTNLYGIIRPKLFGVNAVRHTFNPQIGWSFTPDQSDDIDFYDTYYDEKIGREVQYSRFVLDGGGIASRYESQTINYSVRNTFDAKIAQGDTLDDKNMKFFKWDFSGNYNFMADSLKFSDLRMSFGIPDMSFLQLTSSARFTMYDQDPVTNEYNDDISYTKVNRFLFDEGKGFLRLTNLTLRIGTSFSSDGGSSGSNFNNRTDDHEESADSIETGLGSRFSERIEYAEQQVDLYGDRTYGYSVFNVPWRMGVDLNFSYGRERINRIDRALTLRADFSFKVAETWAFSGNIDYDFIREQPASPNITIHKDLHCWELSLNWTPIGVYKGFYLRFNIKAPQLQDLKYEKRRNPFYR